MTYEPRKLDIITLGNAAAHYAKEFRKEGVRGPSGKFWVQGRQYVMQELYNATYKDAHEFLVKRLRELLDQDQLEVFDKFAAGTFEPRREEVLEEGLLERLAINPAGEHVPGHIGTVQLGNRKVGIEVVTKEYRGKRRWLGIRKGELQEVRHRTRGVFWPVYAGEIEERELENPAMTPLPEDAQNWPMHVLQATNPAISNEAAIAACDAIVDRLDEGSTAPTIRGRSGSQPATPNFVDATESGTLLFTLTMDATAAFGNAADATPGAIATAASITADSTADATNTLGYCRCGATGAGADDHIDGEAAAPSGGDFNFNTLAIVAGAVVSMSSFTVTVPEA